MRPAQSCRTFSHLCFLWPALAILVAAHATGQAAADERVAVTRLPEGAVQPKAVIDASGNLHLAYLRGEASASDVYYSHRQAGETELSDPIRVNSLEKSGLATGSVRGPDIAVDSDGTVHIAWIGSQQAEPRPEDGSLPILYAKLPEGDMEFTEQRNVVSWATGVDGGASIAVDKSGKLAIVWHAGPNHAEESARSIYAAYSQDKGESWGREERLVREELGACSCCDLAAAFAANGQLQFLYRAAKGSQHRDVYLGTASESPARQLQAWELNSCPMSTFALYPLPNEEAIAAWDREGELFAMRITADGKSFWQPTGDGNNRRHPAIAVSNEGVVLVAWTEGTAWARGGDLCWQLFDKSGEPLSEVNRRDDLPVWGTPTAVFDSEQGFQIYY